MAVSTATLYAQGKSSGYTRDIYVVDTAGDYCNVDSSGGGATANSPDEFTFPEDVVITQYIQTGATGQTRTALEINGTPTKDVIRNAHHIPSATNIVLPIVGWKVPAGAKARLRAIA